MTKANLLKAALEVLRQLGLPKAQLNDRSALCLLALVDLSPGKSWADASAQTLGMTPIMDWIGSEFKHRYQPNTRETFRRQTMHQFVSAGIVVSNPDMPERPINSPKTVYQIELSVLELLRSFGTPEWKNLLAAFLAQQGTLVERYAKERHLLRVEVTLSGGKILSLSSGEHSELIRDIIDKFGSTFLKSPTLLYAGDTGSKLGFFDREQLELLNVRLDNHGKMPDVVLWDTEKNWLFLVEAVTSHGPVDGKRHEELLKLFAGSTAGLVFVTAFPTRASMIRFLPFIAWETEVWVADSPSHLIHFNGDRFLGPHAGHRI